MNLKKITKNSIVRRFITFFITTYLKIVILTSIVRIINKENLRKIKSKKIILIFWHGRQLIAVPYCKKIFKKKFKYMYGVTSSHNDGSFVDKIMNSFKIKAIRGSSNKDGLRAFLGILKKLKTENSLIGITVDGPKGPNMKIVSSNVVNIAKMSKASIIPISASVKYAKILNQWDRLMIPRIFNHVTFAIGKEIFIPENIKKSEIDIINQKLENELNETTWNLDKNYGREKIIPGESKRKS